MFQYILRISAIGGASGIQVVLLAGLSLLLARYLSVEEFGITRTVTAYMVVLSMFGHFCLHVATYVAGSKTAEQKTAYVANGSYLVLMISVVVTIIAELFIQFSGFWSGALQRTLSLIVLLLPLASLTTVYSSLLQAIGSYRKLTISLILAGAVQLLFMAPLSARWGLSGWITGRAISSMLLLAAGFWFIANVFKMIRFEKVTTGNLMSFAGVQFISGILSMLMQSADVIALERLRGDMTQVAIYGLASLFGKSVLFLPGAIGRVYFRDIAESAIDNVRLRRAVSHLLLATAGLCVAIALAVFLFVPYAIHLMYGAKYYNSIPVLNVLCIGIVFNGLWSALSVINIAMKNARAAVMISTIGVIVAIGLLYLLIPAYGAMGAAWGMNAAAAAGSLVGLWLLFRRFKINRVQQ
jgi:O-antigen/teichoic acid export membrane protein